MKDNVTVSDLYNSALGFGNVISNDIQRVGKEKAQHDLIEMQAQFDSDVNNFILDLSQRNDYDDWQKEVDAFIQEKKNLIKQKPLEGETNPYYCRNQYTATKAGEMFAGQYESLKNKVSIMTLGKQQDEMKAGSARTKSIIRETPGLDYQQKTDKMRNVSDNDFVDGIIKNYSEYEATVISDASNNYAASVMDAVDNLIEQGASWEEIKNLVGNSGGQVSVSILAGATSREILESGEAAYKDISDMVDTKNIRDQVLKQKKSDWQHTDRKYGTTTNQALTAFIQRCLVHRILPNV